MKDFLLSRADRSPGRRDTATVALTEERGDTFFDALSSETSRRLFQALHERPSTPSELAEEFDTSRQNVHYHIEKLEAADLVEPIDTVYSSRGREMQVYAPTHEAVVLVSGGESTVDRVRSVLSRFLGALAVLLLASLLLQAAVVGLPDLGTHGASEPADGNAPAGGGGGGGDGDAGDAAASPTPTQTRSVARSGGASSDGAKQLTDGSTGSTTTPAGGGQPTATETVAGSGGSGGSTAAPQEETSVTDRPEAGGSPTQYAGGDGAATATPTATATRTATPAPDGRERSPVVYFLAGGVFALVVAAAWQYRRL